MATCREARKSVWGGAKVKFCQTKMETRSCKYGFICLHVFFCQFEGVKLNFYCWIVFGGVTYGVVCNRLQWFIVVVTQKRDQQEKEERK